MSMHLFPADFLTKLANQYQLSLKQMAAFIACFNRGGSSFEIAQTLCISESAFGTRMSGVYAKFSLGGKGPNKRQKLHDFLLKEEQRSISSKPPTVVSQGTNIDELVQQVRKAMQPLIQAQCGHLRVLDISQPLSVGTIYTHVNILQNIPGRRRLNLAELLQDVSPRTFERFGLGSIKETIPGLEAVENHSKLMILGKPGSGKTTFLKHLAIQCIGGVFQSHCVPWFVSLKFFAEAEGNPDLLTYLNSLVPSITGINSHSSLPSNMLIQAILDNGRALILLDGLDEVRETDVQRVLRHVQQFSERYPRSTFVITRRIATREYIFEEFTEVEIADFDEEQIADFVGKWFNSRQRGASQAEEFLEELRYKPCIRELAIRPLLLALLCLVFESSGNFPPLYWKIYRDGFKAMLKKRPQITDTVREPFYKSLSSNAREALFRQLAFATFEKEIYFFDLDTVEGLIKQVLPNCLNSKKDDLKIEDLEIEAFLAAIESQHGILIKRAHEIYSFSHLTFHEYFSARHIVETVNFQSLETLATHLSDRRWREVLFLTLEMLHPADGLISLMKQQIDGLLAEDEKLQQFLTWVDNKATSVNSRYKLVAVRAVYFAIALNLTIIPTPNLNTDVEYGYEVDLACTLDLDFATAFDNEFDSDPNPDINFNDPNIPFDITLNITLALALNFNCAFNFSHILGETLKNVPSRASDPALQRKLQQMKDQLPNTSKKNRKMFQQWWQANGQAWTEQLQAVMIQYRNIGHNWQFSDIQKQKLQQYYEDNDLLVICLRKDVSGSLRQEIEKTMLLPLDKIDRQMPKSLKR